MSSSMRRSRKDVRTQNIVIAGIDVRLSLKNVKNLSLYIKPPDGDVYITAPFHLSMSEIEKFVESKSLWIRRKCAEVAASPHSAAERASKTEIEEWRHVVKECSPPLVREWENIIGVKASKIDFRNMKTRWGSCKPSTGRICINIRLALYPPECLEYVIVHELCHLLERGHGPKFQALMDLFLPDWRERRAKLR